MLYIKNIVFFTSHQKGCEATPSPSYTHVFSLIFLHFASDLSHNSEIFHPLAYAHAEGTPSGALPEQPSRNITLQIYYDQKYPLWEDFISLKEKNIFP